jgi:hypothetical protein
MQTRQSEVILVAMNTSANPLPITKKISTQQLEDIEPAAMQ